MLKVAPITIYEPELKITFEVTTNKFRAHFMFRFSIFGQSDQKTKKLAVISGKIWIFIQKINKQDNEK